MFPIVARDCFFQEYSHSRSNFAFSPYGLASVLVVLYEGAKGESARQIHVAGRFPWDRDITRIGFRDIHRHLRVNSFFNSVKNIFFRVISAMKVI